ncbi:hypothetical protein [Deinococcus roseus]|uniref:General stress protein 17M-like domain-containing protein n=1 Tax=Deinococcus roseus TaxID=392414 RepID=A0ABQ2CUD4_9DEIO|nr:hypothetical protein [Deinococcus roseus]GGJ21655.1 hypothetical protein GCM10008938_04790 [Deinococcus roseus]
MSRITALFDDAAQTQAALQELRALGISDQHILLSHQSDFAAQTEASQDVAAGPTEDGTLDQTILEDVAVQSANRDLYYLPPNNTMAPSGLGTLGTPLVVPTYRPHNHQLATEHLNLGSTSEDSEQEIRFYQEALQNGKMLVSVLTEDSVQEEHARDVLAKHGGHFFAN